MYWRLFIVLCSIALGACARDEAPRFDAALLERAADLAESSLIVDTHIDVPYRLVEDGFEDVSKATENGDFDYPRARAGGLDAPFMSIYVPAEREDDGTATAFANELIDMIEGIAASAPTHFAIPKSVAEIEANFARGVMSLPLGMENGAPIAGDLDNLDHFYDRGIRYITLTHSKSNHICDSSYDTERPWGGLSPFGAELVRAMNTTGMMIDVSHLSDDAFYDVLENSAVPVIASHSSARTFTPGWERNMSDEMIVALAKNGGVIQINFGSTFIAEKSNDNWQILKAARDTYVDEHDFEIGGEEYDSFTDAYRAHTPFEFADLNDVLDHFDHVRDIAGIDHIGIGSDFDGVGDSLPVGLKDVSNYVNLVAGLLERGYSEGDIKKILGQNLVRVWRAVEQYAEQTRPTPVPAPL